MSATSFLRHRRAVAAAYVQKALARSPAKLTALLEEFSLTPGDVENLHANNDVLLLADRIAQDKLDQPELDDLEELNVITVGDRAAVHAPDVRADQFEDLLQHPSAETVGVGNMHDGPEAAEDIVNVGSVDILLAYDAEVQPFVTHSDRDALVEGAKAKAQRVEEVAAGNADFDASKLKSHANLPEVYPNLGPAADQVTAEDEQKPTDPDGNQEGVAATPTDVVEAAEVLADQVAAAKKLADKADTAIDRMDRDALIAYAADNGLDIGEVKERTTPATLRKRVRDALKLRDGKQEPEELAAAAAATGDKDNG